MKAIEINNLTKTFKDLVAVNDLSLSINEGELYALLGVNGAGKSTTIKILTGLIKPTNGGAKILGADILTEPDKVRPFVGVSPQDTSVAPNLTVKENIEFFAEIYGFKKPQLSAKVEEILTSFDLKSIENKRASKLSGGWQRRLSIAMALVTEPKVLFLDEPTLGLDVLARRDLWRHIKALKGKVTIVLTTHYMEEAENLSDKIGIMSNGKLLKEGSPSELIEITKAKNFEEAFVSIVEGEIK